MTVHHDSDVLYQVLNYAEQIGKIVSDLGKSMEWSWVIPLLIWKQIMGT